MRSLQVRCGRILLAAMVSLGLVIPVEAAEEKRGALGAYLEYRDDGVFVSRVVDHLGAGIAGIQPGDVLVSVNGRPVNSVAQVREVVGKAGKSVALLIQRGSDRIFIPVRIG